MIWARKEGKKEGGGDWGDVELMEVHGEEGVRVYL